MLRSIVVSIFIVIFMIVIYLIGYQKKLIPYTEIQDKYFLKEILNDTSSKDGSDKNCRWEYGHFQEYNLFALSCVPKVDPSSFYTIERRYKIKKKFLTIDDEYIMFDQKIKIRMNEKEMGNLGLPIDLIIIHW